MSTWQSLRPDGVPHPFALALFNEEVMFVSGLGGHNDDGTISEDPVEQTRQALSKIEARLARGGFTLDEVVWFHPYVTDVSFAHDMDEVLQGAFGDAPPAGGALIGGVQLADPRMKVEFEVIAVRGASRTRVE